MTASIARPALTSLFLALLALHPAIAAENVALTCADIGPQTTLSTLETRFGPGNVVASDKISAEGLPPVAGFIVFPNDLSRQIVLTFEATRDARVYRIELGRNPKQTSAPWTIAGIRLGASLAEVEALNGEPFALHGFGTEDAGAADDWMNGAFARLGCALAVRFKRTAGSASVARDKPGDERARFTSASPAMRSVKPVVMMVGLERRAPLE